MTIGQSLDSVGNRMSSIRECIRKSLSYDANQGDALLAEACISFYVDHTYQQAIETAAGLLYGHQSNTDLLTHFGFFASAIGRFDLLLRLNSRLMELDPLDPNTHVQDAWYYIATEQLPETHKCIDRMAGLGTSTTLHYAWLAFDEGNEQGIRDQLARGVSEWWSPVWYHIFEAEACYLRGESNKIREILSALWDGAEYVSLHQKSHMALLEGDDVLAFDFFTEAIHAGEPAAIAQIQEPVYMRRILPDFRSHPKYQKMLKDVGLDEESVAKLKIPPLPF